jgi:hypothetical protein
MKTGGVPVVMALMSNETLFSPRSLAVADPSAKKVWMLDAYQATSKAFARGFLRGLLGVETNLRRENLAAGADRVLARGSAAIAYDSRDGTLYSIARGRAAVIARGIGPHAFAPAGDGVVFWNGTLVAQKL